ncbi:MAG TPA: Mur ligase family protein, partial [Mycobacteriales bacterium]|nr:Mur ligase family protein [Mycobacteriales bacterium]
LNVGAAHLGEFGSRAAIAEAKGELVEALPADGVAVLNIDDDHVSAMRARTEGRVITFGTAPDADFRVDNVEVDELARPSFRLRTPMATFDLRLALHGRHQALNAAAALAAAFAADLPLHVAVAAVEAASSVSPHRMQLLRRPDGLLVLDDAYNANPDSMHAALSALSRVAAGRGRAWVVFGPMRELGEESDAMHADIGRAVAASDVAELVTVGADAKLYTDAAEALPGWSGRARQVADVNQAAELLVAEVKADDVVLVKASNSERLWRVAQALVDADVPATDDPADDGVRA